MADDDVHEPEVVDVLVRQHDQLDVVDRVAVLGELVLELVERAPGVRARVDQRQRVVLDQVGVDPPDREGRGDPQQMDPASAARASAASAVSGSPADDAQDLLGAGLHLLLVEPSRLSRRSGSVFEGRTLKCQLS